MPLAANAQGLLLPSGSAFSVPSVVNWFRAPSGRNYVESGAPAPLLRLIASRQNLSIPEQRNFILTKFRTRPFRKYHRMCYLHTPLNRESLTALE
jgi:hypothetical protein